MGIPVKLQVFEGPLDLLLHLIDKNKIDIYDIPIVEITNQYMEYIREMEKEDLNIMSEFLVMAATLLDIKCRMLLPKEVNEEGEEEDPRQELVAQLLEYKMYKGRLILQLILHTSFLPYLFCNLFQCNPDRRKVPGGILVSLPSSDTDGYQGRH